MQCGSSGGFHKRPGAPFIESGHLVIHDLLPLGTWIIKGLLDGCGIPSEMLILAYVNTDSCIYSPMVHLLAGGPFKGPHRVV